MINKSYMNSIMKKLLIIIVIVLIVLCGIYKRTLNDLYSNDFLYPHESLQKYHMPEGVEILVFADRNNPRETIVIEGREKLKGDVSNRYLEITGYSITNNNIYNKEILQIPYPYTGIHRQGINFSKGESFEHINLICAKDNYIACFFNKGNDDDCVFIWFKYDNRKIYIAKKVLAEKIFNSFYSDEYLVLIADILHHYFKSINSNGTQILTHRGLIIDTINDSVLDTLVLKPSDKIYLNEQERIADVLLNSSIPFYHGSMFIEDNIIIQQFPISTDFKSINQKRNYSSFNESCLVLNSIDNKGQLNRNVIIPGLHYLQPSYVPELFAPLSASFDKTLVAFQLIPYEGKNTKPSLWLQVLNLQNNEITPIVEISDKLSGLYWEEKAEIIEWQPSKDNDLIAFASEIDIKIASVKDKKIIKELPNTDTKSMRWSPDGKMLGFLKRGKYEGYPAVKVITPPSLWIYDLEKDQLTKITEDPDYIDFLWVNQSSDPETEFFVKIEEAKYYIVTSVFIIILITILVIKKRKKYRRD